MQMRTIPLQLSKGVGLLSTGRVKLASLSHSFPCGIVFEPNWNQTI